MVSDNFCGGRALRNAVVISGMAIILLASYASVAVGSAVTYTWKFERFAVGINATGSAQDSSRGVMMPDIIKLPDGSYRMYYGASLSPTVSGATTAIKSATSADGINWAVESGYRLLGDGDGDAGTDGIPANEGVISGPRLVRLSNGTCRMYYQASTSGTNPPDFRVKSAISSDGMNWTREGTRVDINYPNGGANQFSLAGHSYVIRFADNDYVILISGNYNGKTVMQPSDLVIGTSNDGLTFSNFSVLYTNGHDPFVVKLADGSGYRLFYGILLERQRTAFSADGRNWAPANQTTETILLNSTGSEVTEASTEAPGDRAALELLSGELILFVNWGSPSANIALMREQYTSMPPAGVTNLTNITYAQTYINWTWTDPSDFGFSKVMVFLDGSFQTNVTKGVQYYNATGLTAGSTHTIATRTMDTGGNVNQTWVNHTATTRKITATSTANVSITGLSFQPQTINVTAGTSVTWTNLDPVPHTVTSDTGLFDSGSLSTGQTFSRTFNAAGNYDYHCNFHPFMTGRVAVSSPAAARTDTPGVYDNSGTWALWNSTSNSADIVGFGFPNTTPVVGDWNGDGRTDIGVYNKGGNNFLLKNGSGFDVIGLGWAGVTPVRGDWNGDGKAKPGVYDNAGTWALWNSTTGAADIVGFGFTNTTPVVGDWNGDGKTDVGIYNKGGNNYLIRNTSAASGFDVIGLGWAGVTPVVGDWNGDGKDKVGVYDNAGTWALWNSTSNSADLVGFGFANTTPVVGDWNGDGKTDVGVYNKGGNNFFIKTDSGATAIGLGWEGVTPVVGHWS